MSESGCLQLSEAFLIFSKYSQEVYATHCEHDTMMVLVSPDVVSQQDIKRLEQLGFEYDSSHGHGEEYFISYRHGSA